MIDTKSKLISGPNKSAIYFGIYERAEIDQARTYCDFSLPVVELGASIGVCTLQMLKAASNKCIAVEANPEIFKLLQKNVTLNFGEAPNSILINGAVDYSDNDFIDFLSGSDNLRGRVSDSADSHRIKHQVPTYSLTKILQDHAIDQYNLVIDIEGAEAGLIIADPQALLNCYRIMGEFDGGTHQGQHYSIEALVKHLQEQGFVVLHRHGNRITFENSRLAHSMLDSE